MMHYILQVVVFQMLFLGIYEVFLRKETFFNHNRAYLLITSVLALIIPFVKLQVFQNVISNSFLVRLPEVVLNEVNGSDSLNSVVFNSEQVLNSTNFNWWSLVYVGSFITLVYFSIRLFKLYKTIQNNKSKNEVNYKIVSLRNSNGAYSFFNYIFLGDLISEEEKQSILTHEKVHAKEKHSIDLLWFEVLKVAFWFNPLVYVYQNRIKEVHEFIADSKSNKEHSENYQNVLLNQLFQIKNLSFVNPFYKKSIIKNRLLMLGKSKSSRRNLMKYLMLIPMVLGMVFYTSCYKEDDTTQQTNQFENLTDEELLQKYIAELKIDKEIFDFMALSDKYFILNNNNYLKTRNEYYKFKAFWVVFLEGKTSKKTSKMDAKIINQTYSDYLKDKKTQEFIDRFENTVNKGTLRKVVKDLENISNQEQRLIDSKLSQIKTDEYYTALVVTDGYSHKLYGTPKQYSNKESKYQSDAKEISFSVVNTVPAFPNCKDISGEDLKSCFSQNMNQLVVDNFNTELANELDLKGDVKIISVFKINENGDLVGRKC